MQYRLVNLLNHPMILDKTETQFIRSFLKTKEMPPLYPFNEESASQAVAYGAALHNKEFDTIDHKQWLGYLFAYPHSEGYRLLSIVDIHISPTLMSGGLIFTPFAALVESDSKLHITPEMGITAFLRYEDMDIITNVLNRQCVYAIRGIEAKANISNWKKQ
jgi:hypothetical protein